MAYGKKSVRKLKKVKGRNSKHMMSGMPLKGHGKMMKGK